jgi:nucleoside transporter
MSSLVKTRLAAMMFLEYAIWGSWYVTVNTYLTSTLHFTGTQAGAAFGTTAVGALVSPFFVGLVADRFFATERVLAVLYAIGALCMLGLMHATGFGAVYGLLLLFCLCFFPSIALTNSITMQQVADPGRDFPPIRTAGTLGWIAINLVVGAMHVEAGTTPFLLAAALCVVMCLFSLTALPHTPPRARGQRVSARSIMGLDALAMMKNRDYLIFVIASVLACIPLTFYYSFTNAYLNDVGVVNAAGKMTLGQMSEVVMLMAMPFVFRILSMRNILVLGLGAWVLRYGLLYTDQEAPAHLRNTAQGFITLITYGAGMLIGSFLSGGALDYFSTTTDGVVTRDWLHFWLTSAAGSLAILLLVLFFFRSSIKIKTASR